jgi:hypothetical protein
MQNFLDIDAGMVFLIILILILMNQFNINIYGMIKFILVIYFLYYINPSMFSSVKQLLGNYLVDMSVTWNKASDKKIVPIVSEKKVEILSTKTENIHSFDRNMASLETGHRSMDASYTENKNFNSFLDMTSSGQPYIGNIYK